MKMKKLIAAAAAAAVMVSFAAPFSQAAEIGDNLSTGNGKDSAAETQKLIDARPDIQRPMENIDRGLVAVKTGDSVFVSWRWLGTESADTKYNLYRNGTLINGEPMSVTNYTDINAVSGAKYQVAPVVDGKEGEKCAEVSVWADGYLDVPIQAPPANTVNGEDYTYSANDASVADLDGDGQYEINGIRQTLRTRLSSAIPESALSTRMSSTERVCGALIWVRISEPARMTRSLWFTTSTWMAKPKWLAARLTAQSRATVRS